MESLLRRAEDRVRDDELYRDGAGVSERSIKRNMKRVESCIGGTVEYHTND